MNIVEYTEFLIKSIAKESDMVSVKEMSTEEDIINLEVLVKDSDMPLVIGRNGVTAKSIRTLVQTYSKLHDNKKVRINIESF